MHDAAADDEGEDIRELVQAVAGAVHWNVTWARQTISSCCVSVSIYGSPRKRARVHLPPPITNIEIEGSTSEPARGPESEEETESLHRDRKRGHASNTSSRQNGHQQTHERDALLWVCGETQKSST